MYSPELIRKLQSRYLQDEARYDKWGAQGKLLLAQEVLHIDSSIALESIINSAFPRTFSCRRQVHPLSSDLVQEYYAWATGVLDGYLDPPTMEHIAIEETAEKFCAPVADVQDLIL